MAHQHHRKSNVVPITALIDDAAPTDLTHDHRYPCALCGHRPLVPPEWPHVIRLAIGLAIMLSGGKMAAAAGILILILAYRKWRKSSS